MLRPLAALFPPTAYPDVLVGLDRADDAAVYRLSADRAIVATTDFFPPVVDDPYQFGAIAAANAMSDVFAMGGTVIMALNLMAVPEDLDPAVVEAIVRGGAEKVREAGGVIAGGHSVADREPKYGLAVIGLVHPERVLRKGGAQPGDVLVLTKPLGTGLITTALKRDLVHADALDAAVASMCALNRTAGEAAWSFGAAGATDITGFGLLGHGLEMAQAAGMCFRFELGKLPLFPRVLDYAADGLAPGGTHRNAAAYRDQVAGLAALPEAWKDVLFDPQTSGGLLVPLAPGQAAGYIQELAAAGIDARVVGSVANGAGIEILA